MANINVDTKIIREKGKDIMQLAIDLNEIIASLYNRINLMPVSTLEWTGPSASEFVSRINLEQENYVKMKETIYSYGRFLVNSADELEEKIKVSKNKVDL